MIAYRLERLAVGLPLRIVLAIAILAIHLAVTVYFGNERFDYHFNDSPTQAPVFHNPARDGAPDHWNRLVVSRWDAQHYIALGLRGLETCKNKSQLASGEYPDDEPTCELDFFPTYGFMGRAVVAVTHAPMDFALLGISLVASFAFILMWTGEEMVAGLGVANVYLSLLLLNTYSTGWTLVTLQTEPVVMALTFGTFICLRKRWFLVGAVLAGACSSVRVTGVVTGLAFTIALAVITVRENPRPGRVLAWRTVLMAISGSGLMALLGYYWWRFGDPMVYSHSHERAFHHEPSLMGALIPQGRLLIQSIWAEPHEGVFLAGALLWLGLGHRKGLAGFPIDARVFWYALTIATVAICVAGSAQNGYAGNSRYMLTVYPAFFAMAALMRRRPAVLAFWLLCSTVHYYNGGLCFYVGQQHPQRLQRCNFARYFRSDELGNE